ncbi:MAG: Hsp70 family protein [Myxococcales bacterium]|nr:Hsp70 family protein [Myxococcales bacterium]
MPDDVVLGIDLGTTNSVVAVADGTAARVLPTELGARLVPSVVSFKADGGIVVGEEARERRLVDAANTIYSVKRLIGRPFKTPEVRRAQQRFGFKLVESANGGVVVDVRGETYTLTEISAFVLREIKRIAEHNLGRSVSRAVITVPANFNELQRSATKAAGRVAGLEVERIINEPTAAALAYGLGKRGSERVAVFDLGGGTFDMTILQLDDDVFEVLSTAGDSFLGGDDIDLVIAELMCDHCLSQHRWDPRQDDQAFERLRAAGEWAKCQLSSEALAELTIEELTYTTSGRPIDLEFSIDRPSFEDAVRPLVAKAFDVCVDALGQARMKATDVDNVVLVGGSTRVPLVREMVRQFFGREPHTGHDPDLVVAQGAAIHGYALRGKNAPAPSLGKAGVQKLAREELAALRAEREERRAALPKQPAFTGLDLPVPVAPKRAGPVGAGARPPSLDAPFPGAPPSKKKTLVGVPKVPPPPPVPPRVSLDAPRTAPASLDAPFTEPSGSFRLDALGGDQAAAPPPLADPFASTVDPFAAPVRPLAPPIETFGASSGDLPGPELPSVVIEAGLPSESFSSTFDIDEWSADDDGALPLPYVPEHGPAEHGQDHVDFDAIGAGAALPMMSDEAPLLMDVTPHSFGIETVGGFCQHLIRRNAPIPSEQSRVFTTGADGQEVVTIRICQGEARSFGENQALGQIELSGLRSAPRGAVKIDVTFLLDASGTLEVRAIDGDTGAAQHIRISLLGGADETEILQMQKRQRSLFGGS